MKLIIGQKNLKKALSIVDKIVSKNASLPILNNILFKTDGGRLKVSATNLEIGVNYVIGAKVDEVGEIAVPARIASDLISSLEDEKITLTTKNNVLSVNSERYKTQILGLNPKDFPIIPKVKENLISVVESKDLRQALLAVFDSIALSETRPELSGVLLNFNGPKIILAATDSFRLAEKKIGSKNTQNASAIIPRNTVVELIRICSEIEGLINVFLSDNQIAFSNDDFELVSRVVDGSYPDYKKVIPEKFIAKTLVSKNELEKNVRLAGLFSSSISDIKISCNSEKTKISAKNSDKGEIETTIDSLLRNEPFEVSINFHYLLDGLKSIEDDKIVIEFNGSGSPLVLKPATDNVEMVYLIMPLRNQA